MFLIHYLNINDNTTYFKLVKHNWCLEEGLINSNNHMILSIFYLDKFSNTILDFKEYKLRVKNLSRYTIPLKDKIINKLIYFLEKLK